MAGGGAGAGDWQNKGGEARCDWPARQQRQPLTHLAGADWPAAKTDQRPPSQVSVSGESESLGGRHPRSSQTTLLATVHHLQAIPLCLIDFCTVVVLGDLHSRALTGKSLEMQEQGLGKRVRVRLVSRLLQRDPSESPHPQPLSQLTTDRHNFEVLHYCALKSKVQHKEFDNKIQLHPNLEPLSLRNLIKYKVVSPTSTGDIHETIQHSRFKGEISEEISNFFYGSVCIPQLNPSI